MSENEPRNEPKLSLKSHPVVGVLVLEVRAARPHLVVELGLVLERDGRHDEGIDGGVEIVVVARRVILDGATLVVPADRSAVAAGRQLAREELRGGAEGLGALPDPLGPLVVRLALGGLAVVEILVIGAAPEEALETGLLAQKPDINVHLFELKCC